MFSPGFLLLKAEAVPQFLLKTQSLQVVVFTGPESPHDEIEHYRLYARTKHPQRCRGCDW